MIEIKENFVEEVMKMPDEVVAIGKDALAALLIGGRGRLFNIGDKARCVMWAGANNEEVVIDCAYGIDGKAAWEAVVEFCVAEGYKTIFFKTDRDGIPRLYQDEKIELIERVYRRDL